MDRTLAAHYEPEMFRFRGWKTGVQFVMVEMPVSIFLTRRFAGFPEYQFPGVPLLGHSARDGAGTFRAHNNLLISVRLAPRMEWNMSDPYSSDQSRRYGTRGAAQAGFWPWLTAGLTALGLLLGGLVGYNWGVEHQRTAQSGSPATTGSAPSQR
jgi:hypothetical protein